MALILIFGKVKKKNSQQRLVKYNLIFLVIFYRDKIEKDQELKNMITGNLKIPHKDDPS